MVYKLNQSYISLKFKKIATEIYFLYHFIQGSQYYFFFMLKNFFKQKIPQLKKSFYNFSTPKNLISIQQLVEPSKAKLIGGWLLVTAFGVFSIIVVGGYTRLTHSGLSIVDWSPYTKVYPKNLEQWDSEFGKYKNSVQYQTVNRKMNIQEFKSIYTVQYVHRKIGVYLGYLFSGPLFYFLYKSYLKPKMIKRLFILLGLGGTQGAIGYWMVKSGINQKPEYQTRPRVSPYRLSLHLMMATTIYSGLLWTSMNLLLKPLTSITAQNQLRAIRRTRIIGIIIFHCILLNIFSGALVAGIDAGKVYNTWPLMNGQIVPQNLITTNPGYRSFFENKALVQFNHRNMAYITQTTSFWLAYHLLKNKSLLPRRIQFASLLAVGMINYQAFSGIITLLNLVPPERANIHQLTAIMTLSSALFLIYVCRIGIII